MGKTEPQKSEGRRALLVEACWAQGSSNYSRQARGSRAGSLFEVCGERSIKGPGGRPKAGEMKEGPHRLPASQASPLPPRCSHTQNRDTWSETGPRASRSVANCCSDQAWPEKGSSHGPCSNRSDRLPTSQEVCPWYLSAPYLGSSDGL